jgi:biopolymer transport protein ExbD
MRRLFALSAMLAIAACSPAVSETSAVEDTNVAQVRAYNDGRITLNDRAVSIAEIRDAFAELSRNNGVVWYYREAADSEPHPNAMLVVESIVDARLPISMSTKSDFSDVVLPDGTARPR